MAEKRRVYYTERQAYVALQQTRVAMTDALVMGRLQTVEDLDRELDAHLERLLQEDSEHDADDCR